MSVTQTVERIAETRPLYRKVGILRDIAHALPSFPVFVQIRGSFARILSVRPDYWVATDHPSPVLGGDPHFSSWSCHAGTEYFEQI